MEPQASSGRTSSAEIRTPLQEITSGDEEKDEEEDEKGWWNERTLWTRVWQGAAISSFVFNFVAMIIEGSAVAIIAGIIALLIAPIVFYFQLELQAEDTLRTVQNQLRKEVNRLQIENNELSGHAAKLEEQVSSLKEKESKLEEITQQQGINVESFVGLVKENQTTLDSLKRCVKAKAEQIFISAILESDVDESNTFSEKEVNMLTLRLKNIPGISFNPENLKSQIAATDGSLTAVMGILSELEKDDVPDEKRIILVDEKVLLEQ